MSTRLTRLAAVVLLASLAAPAGAEEPPSITVDWKVDGAVTGAALALWIGSELARDQLTPGTCRWCTPPRLDAWARDQLAWSDPRAARTASDVLVVGVPVGLAVYDAMEVGGGHAAAADLLVMAESIAVAGVLGQATKFMVARARPYALHGTLPSEGADDRRSFYSGHTTVAFAAAASAGMLAQLRGDQHWPWVYGVGFTAAAATGWLRIAADKHWLTDVLMGAATGTAVGLTVPWLHRSRSSQAPASPSVAPRFLVLSGRF
jgi:membrane-associated phospholipid phosphatase